ncbi:MAG: NACHT domain-containing protein, partial [Anaerolineae bacterium]
MAWNILLSAALEASLGVLAEAGFGDEVRGLKERLTKRGEKARRGAFEGAYRQAVEAAGEENLRLLLEHRPFQEKVITGLLDPETGFDLQAVATEQEDGLSPAQTRALRRFFATLENALLADETWGPLLERFQDLRFRRDVTEALQERRLDVPTVRLVSTVSAQLDGPGTVAQDHSLAAGERGIVVGGKIGGDAITGVKVTFVDRRRQTLIVDLRQVADEVAGTFWQQFAAQRLSEVELRQATAGYLAHLLDCYRYLDFRGMGVSDRVPLRLPLVEMYVPLKARIELPEGETWPRDLLAGRRGELVEASGQALRLAGRRVNGEQAGAIGRGLGAPTPVLDLLQENDGLILLGDPGAGKTTFLKVLALRLALGEGEALGLGTRLPVLLPLSAYANALTARDVPLNRFIAAYYRDRGVDLPIGSMLDEALEQGGALLLLDGLDEVKDLARRHLVVQRVVEFFNFQRRRGNKFVLSSRVVGYREVRPVAEGLVEGTLEDFGDEEIAHFVERWTGALERAARGDTPGAEREAERERRELLDAVRRNPGVRRLAANPLLLTILALMKRQGVTLPERRVELYEQYVRTLLSSWNRARGLGRPPARDLDVVETVRILAPLALWMHETSPGVGLVKQGDLRRKLVEIYRRAGEDAPERAGRRFLRDVREYAGLLLERGAGQYGFIHLTFEEYLAAVGVARLGQRDIAPVVELL